jgi:hypothetical protein
MVECIWSICVVGLTGHWYEFSIRVGGLPGPVDAQGLKMDLSGTSLQSVLYPMKNTYLVDL